MAVDSAAYRLFHHWYSMLVPAHVTVSEVEMENFGIVMSGNADWDNNLSTASTPYCYQGMEIAILHARGVPITFIRPTDAVTLYLDILEHLGDWSKQARYTATAKIPLAGLTEFHNLATDLIRVARCHGLVNDDNSSFKHKNVRSISRTKVNKINLAKLQHPDSLIKIIKESKGTEVNYLLRE